MTPRLDPGSDQASLLVALSGGSPSTASGGRKRGRTSGQGPSGRGLLYWLPVALALGLFALVSLKGLKPALAESGRLLRAEEELLQRHATEAQRGDRLDRVRRAQSDPIYLERERRRLIDPQGGLLGR